MKILIFGFGYSAAVLAEQLFAQGWQVYGTSRNVQKREHYNALGYNLVDFTTEAVVAILPEITHILISTSQRQGEDDPVLHHFSALLEQHAPHIKWIGYFSTTGIYGDHKGNWVDEQTPIVPAGWRVAGRYASENKWLDFGQRHVIAVCIFRLAGIYGAGRNALHQIREGKVHSVYKKDQVFSRIHVEDIANVVLASIHNPQCTGIFNVCDNEAAPSHEVLEYAARLLEVPAPVRRDYDKAELSEMAKDFYSNNRRVRNDKIKQMLKVEFIYPTYREGLKRHC